MAPLPNADAYPKVSRLRDGTAVEIRPLQDGDKIRLAHFFERIPESERYYLKENVTSPEVIAHWTNNIDFDRVVPLVAISNDQIVADATLHRSRAPARRHVGELRVVVDPEFRELGLGRRLIRELLDIASEMGLNKATFELVAQRETAAIMAAESVGFQVVATLKGRIRDMWGNYQDLVMMELPLQEHESWWRF
ncbi:MAG: GNAT family N-acetyltransferase [SAR202 cluster bacterium]|nr:GNAT family N-acetyltransferase [SAR202 cluster bacterium]